MLCRNVNLYDEIGMEFATTKVEILIQLIKFGVLKTLFKEKQTLLAPLLLIRKNNRYKLIQSNI
ncbi:MAG: hypothetical protein K2M01_02255, partial [Paramuribaculum sp.]|nr:hypothetical protein [Paramuribaculum sp.]